MDWDLIGATAYRRPNSLTEFLSLRSSKQKEYVKSSSKIFNRLTNRGWSRNIVNRKETLHNCERNEIPFWWSEVVNNSVGKLNERRTGPNAIGSPSGFTDASRFRKRKTEKNGLSSARFQILAVLKFNSSDAIRVNCSRVRNSNWRESTTLAQIPSFVIANPIHYGQHHPCSPPDFGGCCLSVSNRSLLTCKRSTENARSTIPRQISQKLGSILRNRTKLSYYYECRTKANRTAAFRM